MRTFHSIPQVAYATLALSLAQLGHGTLVEARNPSPGPASSIDTVLGWCDQTVSVLHRFQAEASIYRQYRRTDDAVRILKGGLQVALRGWGRVPGIVSPMTSTAIVRTQTIVNQIEPYANTEASGAAAVYNYLNSAYSFIIDIATQFDRPYFIPHYYGCTAGCYHQAPPYDIESSFLSYSKQQVEMIMDAMLINDGRTNYPLGASSAYLSALRTALEFLAMDLSVSYYNRYYACTMQEARALAGRIASYVRPIRTPVPAPVPAPVPDPTVTGPTGENPSDFVSGTPLQPEDFVDPTSRIGIPPMTPPTYINEYHAVQWATWEAQEILSNFIVGQHCQTYSPRPRNNWDTPRIGHPGGYPRSPRGGFGRTVAAQGVQAQGSEAEGVETSAETASTQPEGLQPGPAPFSK